MIKKLKRLWKLANKDEKSLELLQTLTEEQIAILPEANEGDGKAAFFGEGTEEEWEEQVKEDKGLKGWYERLKNL